MNNDLFFILKLLQKEVWNYRKLVMFLYVLFAIVFLILAWSWPRIFTSSSTILIDQQNILRPLLEGTAVTTNATDRARLAREIIFSQESKEIILDSSDWFENKNPTPIEEYSMFEGIRSRTDFTNIGQNLIRVSYSDMDAIRALETARLMTKIFIESSQLAKQDESRSAYQFIDKQVGVYREKLKEAENALKIFRSNNIDSAPRSVQVSNDRITQLKRQMEDINLEIEGEKSSIIEREKQLSGESEIGSQASIDREIQINTQISALNTQLSTLRLSYLDSYPDIVQVKTQMQNLQELLDNEIKSRQSPNSTNGRFIEGTFAQTLKTEILNSRTNISTLESRMFQVDRILTNEKINMSRINEVGAELAELTRDYTVNQGIYQQLLRQRENAHISMNIDIDNEGLSIKIQEPAFLAVTPEGLRFGHIILAGLILSFAIPLAIVFALSLIDGKVRNETIISDKLNLQILAGVHKVHTTVEASIEFKKAAVMSAVVLIIWAVYGYAIWLRLQG